VVLVAQRLERGPVGSRVGAFIRSLLQVSLIMAKVNFWVTVRIRTSDHSDS